MDDVKKNLHNAYPLSSRWSDLETFAEVVEIGAARFDLNGFAATSSDGLTITGAAVGGTPIDRERAWFELLERAAVVDAMALKAPVEMRTANGQPLVAKPRAEIFPVSPQPDEWQFSKSNGVAAHLTWEQACAGAALELLERDRILRSWFFGGVPRPLPLLELLGATPAEHLGNLYDFRLFELGDRGGGVVVHGFFAFPRTSATDAPVVYGFGAGATGPTAARRARDECLQRLAFLWGERVTAEELVFAPTPDFHQAYYMRHETIATLESWLGGLHDYRPIGDASSAAPHLDEIIFADLTPPELRGKAFVVKALHDQAVPLFFGRRFGSGLDLTRRLHPVA